MNMDVSSFLNKNSIEAISPTRVDIGGGVDHRLISVLCNNYNLITFNVAINLFSKIRITSYASGEILIQDENMGTKKYRFDDIRLDSDFSLVLAILKYFGAHGLKIEISCDYPLRSGIGGSSSIAITLIGALDRLMNIYMPKNRHSLDYCISLSHVIEDGLFHNTGLQDQASSYYGGINLWKWSYLKNKQYQRISMNDKKNFIEKHSCLVFSGREHYSSLRGSKFVNRFITSSDSFKIVNDINNNTKAYIRFLSTNNLSSMVNAMNNEYDIRSSFMKFNLNPELKTFINNVRNNGCGVKFTGGGGGGFIWIIGSRSALNNIKKYIMAPLQEYPFTVAQQGLMIMQK